MENKHHTEKKLKLFDLVSNLGVSAAQAQQPGAVDINRYSLELFFQTYHRNGLLYILTSDHIEHGFKTLTDVTQTNELKDLKMLIDQCFIFAFCNIIVNDGSKRANLFLDRQSKWTSFSNDFIQCLKVIEPESIDGIPEISQFLMNPKDLEFSESFYANLNKYLAKNPVPGFIYLLRNFLHDEQTIVENVKCNSEKDINDNNLKFGYANMILPFNESNIPHIVYKSHDPKSLRISPTLILKKPVQGSVHIPSLTSTHLPENVYTAVFDPKNYASAYCIGSELFYLPSCEKAIKLKSHQFSISAIAFSTNGNYVLSGDTMGNIQLQNINDKKVIYYQNVRNAITSISFYNNIFVVGTIIGNVYYFETSSTKYLRCFSLHTDAITFLQIHPNCEYFVSASMDSLIRVYSFSLGVCVRVWKQQNKIPLSCRFSNNGRMLIITFNDGLLNIFDIGTGNLIRSMSIDAYTIDSIFSPDDQTFAVVDKSGGFSLWETNEHNKNSLIVLRIDHIEPIVLSFLSNDEIRVIGQYKEKSFNDE